jgi:hypothetical protein
MLKHNLRGFRLWGQVIGPYCSPARALTPVGRGGNHDIFFPQVPSTGPYRIVGEQQPEPGNHAA